MSTLEENNIFFAIICICFESKTEFKDQQEQKCIISEAIGYVL